MRSLAAGTALVAAVAALAAGCGGNGSDPSVASLGPSTTTTATDTPSSSAGGSTPSAGTSRNGGSNTRMQMAGGSHMTQFAACMRSHGVPNFPDPNAQGVVSIGSSSGLDPDSPQFRHAQQVCQKDVPQGPPPSPAQQQQIQKEALEYSACMRAHGLPKFPDPQFSGGHVQMSIGPNSGIDPQSPQFQAAQKACQDKLPGKGGPGGLGTAKAGP